MKEKNIIPINRPGWIRGNNWAASSEFGTCCLCEHRRFGRAWASAQSRQNLRCLLIQAVSQAEPSDEKPDPWPLWMAGHAQLKFVMTECSKTQICLTRHNLWRTYGWTWVLGYPQNAQHRKSYRKFPKYSDTQKICCNHKFELCGSTIK